MKNQIFISHASEDKDAIAKPLALALLESGLKVWYDEFSLTLGDSLRKSIDLGLSSCDFGVVILSESFFNKEWTQIELEGLTSKEIEFGKTILPVWHNIDKNGVMKYSPSLANKIAVSSDKGIDYIVSQIIQAITRKKDQLKIRKQTQDNTELFQFINFEISGSKFKDLVQEKWIKSSGISSEEIETIEIYAYEDYSGIQTGYKTGVYLKDGTKMRLNDLFLSKIISDSIPDSLNGYEILYWVPEPDEYLKQDLIPIEKCNLNIIAAKTDKKITNSKKAYEHLNEIINFFESASYDMHNSYYYGSIFNKGTYSYKLVKKIIENNSYDLLNSLIFENLDKNRLSWEISQIFIGSLEKDLSKEELTLLKKLVEEDEPLNDYWRDKIKLNFIEKAPNTV